MTIINPKSISGITSITTASGADNLLTVHTNNTTERIRINNDGDVIVGSGITVSPDGDIFATGVTTSTTFVGALTGNVTGNVSGSSGSATGNAGGLTGTPNISVGTIAGSTGTFSGDVSITDKIVHTDDTNTAIRFPAADTFSVETAGSTRLHIHSDGRFRVGTTAQPSGTVGGFQLDMGSYPGTARLMSGAGASGTESASLAIGGSNHNASIENGANSGGKLDLYNYNSTDGNSTAVSYHNSNGLAIARVLGLNVSHSSRNGALVFMTSTASYPTEKARITSGGEVGINATNPQSMLEVLESSTTQSETDKRIAIFRKNGTTSGDEGYIHLTTMTGHYGIKLGYRNEGGSPGYLNQGFFISTVNNNENITNHTKKFIILSDGRISLGSNLGSYTSSNMSSAADDLVVTAPAGANGGMTIVNSGTNDIGNIFFAHGTSETGIGRIQYEHQNNAMVFYANNGQRLRIDNTGKLIMGSGTATNDTSERFLVDGSGSSDHCGLGIKTNNNVHDGYIAFHDTDATYRGKIVYDHEHDDMWFGTNGATERLRIDSGGNIGVGNFGTGTIPQKLSVLGSMYMRQGDLITWNNGDCDIGGISGYHLRFRTYTGSSNTEKMRITSKGVITTPLSPTSYDGNQASAIVNTSGRQMDNNNDFQTNYKQNLSVGWYTIATNTGGRAWGKIGIRETYSSRHQAVTIFAGHHYGGNSDQNSLHTISSGRHSGNPLGAVRIKAYGTYDGAMLQVYLRDGSNGVQAYLLGDNIQTHGWKMKDWIADGTDPGDLGNWSSINSNGGSSAYADLNNTQAGGTTTDGHIIPGRDNATDLGTPSYRFDDVFATNTTIQSSSDERLKQDITALTTAEMNAAKRMSALFKTYRWKDRVLEKGDKARTHTGVIAQQVKAALEAEGLDPTKYGFYGFDEWYEDSEGTKLPIDAPTRQGDPVGINTNTSLGGSIVVPDGFEKKSLYSIRIGELLAFIAAYNEQRFTSIESRLTALEG